MLRIKRVYEAKESGDGVRILVDRLWPRGLSKSRAAVDEWRKELAPSDELRKWFGYKVEKWPEFKRRYAEEMRLPEKAESLKRIARLADEKDVTLLYAAKDTGRNNAVVLIKYLSKLK